MDTSRNTRFVRILKNYFMKNDLVSVWEKFPADFTYQHTDLTSFSTIDHFYVTRKFLDNCLDAAPIHDGSNRSNHSPIMLKIRVPEVIEMKQPENAQISKPNWWKATDEDIEHYSQELHSKLCELPLPESIHCSDVLCTDLRHSHERDSHVIDILVKIIETSYQCLPLTRTGKPNKTQSLPGFNENVRPFKEESLFWHAVWYSDGRKRSGGLFNIMKITRNRYHHAVRLAKREARRMEAETLIMASESGNMALINEMKRHLNNKRGSGQEFPDSLHGKVTHEDILHEFKESYSALYNSADTSAQLQIIKENIQKFISENACSSLNEVNKITPEVVMDAVDMMKSRKNDVSGHYTSDCFKNAPEELFTHLAAVFKSFCIHGSVTEEILHCAFIPLFKGGLKPQDSFHSYRAIAGASQVLKIFEYVILKLWGDLMVTDSLQFGFKKERSCAQASWVTLTVSEWYYQRGGMVHSCFLDLTKAFDQCLFSKLFQKILDTGVPPIAVRAFIFAYQEQKAWVRIGSSNSETFRIQNGTRQGSILSPAWFGIYLNDLLQKLRKLGLGCHVAGVWLGALAYADDLCLLSPNRHVLQKMVTICQEYGLEHNLAFSTDPVPAKSKTKCVLFKGNKRVEYPAPIMLNGEPLPWVPVCEHLGHKLHESLTMDSDISRAKATFKDRAADVRERLYFSHPTQKAQAIQVFASSNYGAMLWDLQSEATLSYFRCWNIQIRLAFDLSYATHCNILENVLCKDQPSLRKQIYSQYPKFVRKLLESPIKEVRFLAAVVINDQRSTTCRNISFLNDICKNNVMMMDKWSLRKSIPRLPAVEPWRESLLKTCLQIRYSGEYSQYNVSKQQNDQFIESLCIS